MELEQLREQISALDEQMVDLFKQRMDLAAQVAEYKQAHHMAVLDRGRERAVLSAVADRAGEDYADYAQAVYQTIMATSRAYQNSRLNPDTPLSAEVKQLLRETPDMFPQRATVACQGTEGAYSQQAAERIFKTPDIMFFDTFENVFKAVEQGLCRYGVLPIENSTAGSVNRIYDLMLQHKFSIVRAARIRIDHCLLAKPGTQLSDVKEIFSHEQALRQCSNFLDTLKDVKITVVENTAIASQMVANSERTDVAAISSRFCAENYGLTTLHRDIMNHENNYTRFICISRKPEVYAGADKTSIMMILSHKPGSLYHVLAKFFALGINLVKLESRPFSRREFEFMFYFDIEASVYSPQFQRLLCDLTAEGEDVRYLGTYSEVVG